MAALELSRAGVRCCSGIRPQPAGSGALESRQHRYSLQPMVAACRAPAPVR